MNEFVFAMEASIQMKTQKIGVAEIEVQFDGVEMRDILLVSHHLKRIPMIDQISIEDRRRMKFVSFSHTLPGTINLIRSII